MTSRERWVLYPLLFLTLGIVMRDKFIPATVGRFKSIDAQQVQCENLDIVGPTGKYYAVRMGVDHIHGSGLVEVRGKNGKTLAVVGTDRTGESGLVETLDSKGHPQVMLWSHQCGGVVTTVGADRKIRLSLGHLGMDYGVFAESAELGRRMKLSLPWRFDY